MSLVKKVGGMSVLLISMATYAKDPMSLASDIPQYGVGAKDNISLNLSATLKLALERNPEMALAEILVSQAALNKEKAKLLAVPDITIGAAYQSHDGNIQQTDGGVIDADRSSRFLGLGSGQDGQSGIEAEFHLADIFYKPVMAEHAYLAQKEWAESSRQDLLYRVGEAYLSLLLAHIDFSIDSDIGKRAKALSKVTNSFANTGEGLRADAELAAYHALSFRSQIELSGAQRDEANAQLVHLLNLSPGVVIQPSDTEMPVFSLFTGEESLQELIEYARKNRPELNALDERIAESEYSVKNAKLDPFVPTLAMNYGAGDFAGGSGSALDNNDFRSDWGVSLQWKLKSFGLGNLRDVKLKQSQLQYLKYQKSSESSQIVASVRALHSRLKALKRSMSYQQDALKHAEAAYKQNSRRIFDNAGLPLEALAAMQANSNAQTNYSAAVYEYNRTQLDLMRTIGDVIKGDSMR